MVDKNITAGDGTAASAIRMFAWQLLRARRDAGDLSFRQLATRIQKGQTEGWGSRSTLQRAFAGDVLPSWPVVEALLVDGFNISEDVVQQQWRPLWVKVKDLVEPLDPPFPTGLSDDGVVVPMLRSA